MDPCVFIFIPVSVSSLW